MCSFTALHVRIGLGGERSLSLTQIDSHKYDVLVTSFLSLDNKA